jgi:hypothetical protein
MLAKRGPELPIVYSGCQKNVAIAVRFFATTLMPPSFFRNIIMTSGINRAGLDD